MPDDPTLSANCRAQHRMPHRPQQAHCTGCACSCHGVRPPANFRALVEHQRARRRAANASTTSSRSSTTD